jgi:hypothetical protein
MKLHFHAQGTMVGHRSVLRKTEMSRNRTRHGAGDLVACRESQPRFWVRFHALSFRQDTRNSELLTMFLFGRGARRSMSAAEAVGDLPRTGPQVRAWSWLCGRREVLCHGLRTGLREAAVHRWVMTATWRSSVVSTQPYSLERLGKITMTLADSLAVFV